MGARLILVNGPPAAGKSTLARRFVDEHQGAYLVEIDELRMTLPNWEEDAETRLGARDLAAALIVEQLDAGHDVVMAQYFGRLGYVVLLDELTREHDATFVEVVLSMDAATAVERFRARRRELAARGERHPERDVADADAEPMIVDAVDRLTRLPTARPATRLVRIDRETDEDEAYRRLLAALDLDE